MQMDDEFNRVCLLMLPLSMEIEIPKEYLDELILHFNGGLITKAPT